MDYKFSFNLKSDDWHMILDGAINTVLFSVGGMALGLLIGIFCAIWRVGRNEYLKLIATVYVEFIRNTPILVQLFIIYFGLPTLGLRLSSNTAALVALIFNFGAYATEIIRAGIECIPRGQIEAALSLGLRRWEIYRHVVILPALDKVYPSLASQFTLLMLGTSIVSVIGASELTSAANTIQSINFRSFEVYLIVAGIYLLLTLALRFSFAQLANIIFPRRRAVGVASQEVA